MMRADGQGRIHLGLSVPFYDARLEGTVWTADYEVQVAGPLLPSAVPTKG